MTRDDLKGIINGVTDEQLNQILNINSKDIGKALSKSDEFKDEIQRLKDDITAKNDTISQLKNNLDDVDELKAKIDAYEQEETQRKEQEKKATVEKELQDRFSNFASDKKFINELTKDGIFREFKEAISHDENKGKGDREIFDSIVKDRPNIFENPNKPADIAGIGKGTDGIEIKPSVPKFF